MSENHTSKQFPQNEALQVFAPLIGTWKTEGTHGMIPDTVLHGCTTFSWHESGAFILMRSSIDEDVGIPEGLAIIGSDGTLRIYEMLYFDERGVSRLQRVSIEGFVITWWRDEQGFSQRNMLTLSEDGQTITGKGEICKDGTTWEQDLDLTYSKI